VIAVAVAVATNAVSHGKSRVHIEGVGDADDKRQLESSKQLHLYLLCMGTTANKMETRKQSLCRDLESCRLQPFSN